MSNWRELESNSWWNVGGNVRENAQEVRLWRKQTHLEPREGFWKMGNTKACLCADANRKGLKMGSEAVKSGREGGRESRSPGEGLTLVRVTSEGGAEIWRLEAEGFLSECFYFLNKKLRSWMGVGAAGQRRFMEREKTWNGYLRKVRKCLKTPGRNRRSVSWWPWVRQWFVRYDTKSTNDERKLDKLDYIKIKNPCAVNSTKKVTRKLIE